MAQPQQHRRQYTREQERGIITGFALMGMALLFGMSQPTFNGFSFLACLQALAGLALILEVTRRG